MFPPASCQRHHLSNQRFRKGFESNQRFYTRSVFLSQSSGSFSHCYWFFQWSFCQLSMKICGFQTFEYFGQWWLKYTEVQSQHMAFEQSPSSKDSYQLFDLYRRCASHFVFHSSLSSLFCHQTVRGRVSSFLFKIPDLSHTLFVSPMLRAQSDHFVASEAITSFTAQK